jgi:hypothetical protein
MCVFDQAMLGAESDDGIDALLIETGQLEQLVRVGQIDSELTRHGTPPGMSVGRQAQDESLHATEHRMQGARTPMAYLPGT